jgi:xanthine dehydrogenase YagS FAD-binding subunit
MTPFTYTRARTIDEALRAYAAEPNTQFIGGGTNLLDLMKMGTERPTHIVDINKLPLRTIEEHDGGLRIGALVSNTAAANHKLVRSRYPVLSEAILAGATQQLRNKATMGGNLLQRTRCPYFYDPTFRECNKRVPGSGCAAIKGYNRMHAILGASAECIAVQPSDMCVALMALDAVVRVTGPNGERTIPMRDFHRLPGNTPQIDTNLRPGELIASIDLPPIPYGRRSAYIKVRDRNSYAFALLSVATVLDASDDGTIRKVHLALGGVAHKPWRAMKAESMLSGKKADETTLRSAAEAELQDAKAYRDNAFKIELVKRCITRGVLSAMSAA